MQEEKKNIERILINLGDMHEGQAKISRLDLYISASKELAGQGNRVILTGPAPVWMYLRIAHALHGRVLSLSYASPATGEVVIYDHNPF